MKYIFKVKFKSTKVFEIYKFLRFIWNLIILVFQSDLWFRMGRMLLVVIVSIRSCFFLLWRFMTFNEKKREKVWVNLWIFCETFSISYMLYRIIHSNCIFIHIMDHCSIFFGIELLSLLGLLYYIYNIQPSIHFLFWTLYIFLDYLQGWAEIAQFRIISGERDVFVHNPIADLL